LQWYGDPAMFPGAAGGRAFPDELSSILKQMLERPQLAKLVLISHLVQEFSCLHHTAVRNCQGSIRSRNPKELHALRLGGCGESSECP
jgi:hypothetical protein